MKESTQSMGACGRRWGPLTEQGVVAAPARLHGELGDPTGLDSNPNGLDALSRVRTRVRDRARKIY
jgi:hypothetical protein